MGHTRVEIVKFVVEKNNYKSYAEIGTDMDACISQVKCDFKVGVDPSPRYQNSKNCDDFLQITSDEFFECCNQKYDCIFIDGLHTYQQVKKDLYNALDCLNDSGTIIIHDCNPKKAEDCLPEPQQGIWNGDVYKIIIDIRKNDSNLIVQTINEDYGCGVIRKGKSELFKGDVEYTFEWFDKNRKEILNLVKFEDFKNESLKKVLKS